MGEKLPLKIAADQLEKIKPELGTANRARAEVLQSLCRESDGAELIIRQVLERVFPDSHPENAKTALRKFRIALKAAASEAGLALEFCVADDKKASVDRTCWFQGDDLSVADILEYSASTSATGSELLVAPKGRSLPVKQTVRFFVSYAHDDEKLVDRLHRHISKRLHSSKTYAFKLWQDKDLVLGKDWDRQIKTAIDQCDLGFLLLSPAFFTSEYIKKAELPNFCCLDGKRSRGAIPVGLEKFEFGRTDMCGLENDQVFRYKDKFFNECQGNKQQVDFAEELCNKIHDRLAIDGPARTPSSPSEDSRVCDPDDHLCGYVHAAMREFLPECRHMVPTKGRRTRLDRLPEPGAQAEADESIDALADIQAWLDDEEGPPFYALLGDLGMGKTSTCRMLTQKLIKDNPAVPPIYMDLRDLENRKPGLTLQEILADILKHSWHVHSLGTSVTPESIVRLVQEKGALIIFDGLDEVLVHLDTAQGQRFTRELWRILPTGKDDPKKTRRSGGRMLISCRTHYFPTRVEQNSHFRGEDREGIKGGDYRGLILLPFTEEQIRSYLNNNFQEKDTDRMWETLTSIHNLTDLATRPYTLSVIAEHLEELEKKQLHGETVLAVDLYEEIIGGWLNRDNGKHQLTKDHKRRLMEDLAAAIWQDSRLSWDHRQLEDWLVTILAQRPEITRHYILGSDQTGLQDRKVIELFKEDLRTATFIVRSENDRFRFGHTSLLEFFLACHLYRALTDNRPDNLAIAGLNTESCHFLGELLAKNGGQAVTRTIGEIRGKYLPVASENLFRYALLAKDHGYPGSALTGWDLRGANLCDLQIIGKKQERLNLSGCDFTGADLRRISFQMARLDACRFIEAKLLNAEFLNCGAREASFHNAELTGTIFRNFGEKTPGTWQDVDFRTPSCHRGQWLAPLAATARPVYRSCLFNENQVLGEAFPPTPSPLISKTIAQLTGHQGWVKSCRYCPDGRTIVSAGQDGSVRIWDAASGDCLQALTGHQRWVCGCGYGPDGRTIVSAGNDGSVRIWDAASGDCLKTLTGHQGTLWGCGYGPGGRTIVSAGEDGSVRIWDAGSGNCLQTLTGHQGGVLSCGYGPDDRTIVSAGSDGSVRIWDAASGDCLQTLTGHQDWVGSCGYGPDGRTIVSAGSDGSVRIWDAASGDCLQTITGHQGGVWSCGYAPDGRTIVSAGEDGSVRIWDAASGDCLQTLTGHEDWVLSCGYGPDSRTIVSAGSDGSVRIWDAASGDCLQTLTGHEDWVFSCGYAPDGRTIVSANQNGSVRIWDATSGDCLQTLTEHPGRVWSCGYGPDGRTIVSAGLDGSVRIWDATSGDCLQTLTGHQGLVFSCGCAPDGRTIVSAGDDSSVRIWNAASGDCLQTLIGHEGEVWSCGYAPDGRTIVSAGEDGSVRIWDAVSGDCLQTLIGHEGGVWSCGYVPDGRTIVSAGDDGSIRIWDAASGGCLQTITGHQGGVLSCGYAPDGRTIISAGDDGSVRIWDAVSGDCLQALTGHRGGVLSCGFAPDGRTIVSAGKDGSVRIWDAASGELRMPVIHTGLDDWAAIDYRANRVVHCGPEAWRHLAWLAPDAKGRITRYPVEIEGPLPIKDC